MERIRCNYINNIRNSYKKIKDKLKSKDGDIGVQTIFIVYIGAIVISFFFQVFTCYAIVSSVRDTLDSATLSATSKAMTTPEVYMYLRENDRFNSSTDSKAPNLKKVCNDELDASLNEILTTDLGLSIIGDEYKKGNYYTVTIKSDDKYFDVNTGTFIVNANVDIPVNIFNGTYHFNVDVTSKARFANKNR